ISKEKPMNKLVVKSLALIVVTVGLVVPLQANQISGSIGFFGTFSQVGGTLGQLNTATSFTDDTLNIAIMTGDFLGATTPTFPDPIGVKGNPPPIGVLWTVVVGSKTYTFTVTSETQTFTSPNQINLAGTGVVSDGNPANDTAGTWQLGFGMTGDAFT